MGNKVESIQVYSKIKITIEKRTGEKIIHGSFFFT